MEFNSGFKGLSTAQAQYVIARKPYWPEDPSWY